jgi:hypothetical protein
MLIFADNILKLSYENFIFLLDQQTREGGLADLSDKMKSVLQYLDDVDPPAKSVV